MTNPDMPRHVEVKDGDQTVVAAEVTTSKGAGRTVQASLHATPGHIAPGRRARLVDAVMDLPEVQASERLEATVPLGDSELLERLRERTKDAVTRPAGSTALLDASIPSDRPTPDSSEPPTRLAFNRDFPERAVVRRSSVALTDGAPGAWLQRVVCSVRWWMPFPVLSRPPG